MQRDSSDRLDQVIAQKTKALYNFINV